MLWQVLQLPITAAFSPSLVRCVAGDCCAVSSLPLVRFRRLDEASNKAGVCDKLRGKKREGFSTAEGQGVQLYLWYIIYPQLTGLGADEWKSNPETSHLLFL